VPLLILLWLIAAVAIGGTGALAHFPVPPPAIAIALTALLLLLLWLVPAFRARVKVLGPAPLVAFHWLRLPAGAYFLWLWQRGVLPEEFAKIAGWGDIAVALTAVLVFFVCLPIRTTTQRNMLLLWNALGLLDILLVLSNGVRLFLRDPSLAVPFTTLPLALLPLFVVPIVIASHIFLFFATQRPRV